jgi:uncharacterized protein YggE
MPRRNRLAVGILLGVLSMMTPASAGADTPAGPERRTVTVTGIGEVATAPDLAIVTVAVETTAPKANDAARENAQRSERVSAALKALLGKDDKIETSGYSLDPRYAVPPRGEQAEPRITGYVARNDVRVQTKKIDAVGALVDAAIAAGANRISGVQFTLDTRSAALRSALQKAGVEARAQAEAVATALGVSLRRVVSASTTAPAFIQPRRVEAFGMRADVAAAPPTPIEPGEVTVSATLQVTYEIE